MLDSRRPAVGDAQFMRGHGVAVGVDRVAAPRALRPAGGDDSVGVVAERVGLAAGHVEADVAAVGVSARSSAVAGFVVLVVVVGVGRLEQLLELHEQAVVGAGRSRARSVRARRRGSPARAEVAAGRASAGRRAAAGR